jgi:hypothetical protein
MVTAETALVLPLVVAFSLALTFLVSLGVDQVRLVDASRDAARAVAAGSSIDAVTAAARRTAPGDARVTIQHDGDLVEVTVTSHVDGPGWLLVPVPGVTLRARATVQAETADVGV